MPKLRPRRPAAVNEKPGGASAPRFLTAQPVQSELGLHKRLQKRLGYCFKDPALLSQALTHRSFSAQSYERLEFLGDAVLSLAIAHRIYDQLKGQPEGDLSRLRASLVREETLHGLALTLGLPVALKLGAGEIRTGGQTRPSILADAIEAIIGAVFLDGGYSAAEYVVRELFRDVVFTPQSAALKDAKTALQEWLQANHLKLPLYRVEGTSGADHRQVFDVSCSLEGLGQQTRGEGTSRRAAEQMAAAKMLEILQKKAR